MDIESEYLEKKGSYDKVAVGLEMDKLALEKECDTFQVFILFCIVCVLYVLFCCIIISNRVMCFLYCNALCYIVLR